MTLKVQKSIFACVILIFGSYNANIYKPNMSTSIDREELKATSVDAVNNLLYTVVFDLANDIISAGGDEATVLKCASDLINKYTDDGVKVRKRPVPKPKAPKKEKERPIDVLTAATRKLGISSKHIDWVKHPENDNYYYSTSVKLATGYPVKDSTTNKIVMVLTDDESGPLTAKDAKVAITYGLDVDYASIKK